MAWGYEDGFDALNPAGAFRAVAPGAICAQTTMIRTIRTPSARKVLIVWVGADSIRVESWMIEI